MIKLLALFFLSFATTACGNWQHTANAAIPGYNNVHLNDVTIEQCKDSCCADPRCKSFDYYKQSSQCDLSYSSASDVGGLKTDYAGSPYDHYALDREMTCATPTPLITSLSLDHHQNTGVVDGCCNNDLNFGAKGDFIYLHAQKNDRYPTNELPAISDIFLSYDTCGHDAIKVEGCCDHGDLNNNSGGRFLYLCYKVKSGNAKYVSDLKLLEGRDASCHKYGTEWERVTHGNSVPDSITASNGDLNEGVHDSPFIYLCMKKTVCQVSTPPRMQSIGYWTFISETKHPNERPFKIKRTFAKDKSRENARNELQSIHTHMSESHSAEVAVALSAQWKMIEASLETKYGYMYEHGHAREFQRELADTARETYEQADEIEFTVTIPAMKPHEPKHVNIWMWQTEVIKKDSANEYAGSSYISGRNWMQVSGCGYDIPPNCLPGRCNQHDKHCWTCTADIWKIDPNFKPPKYCDPEKCGFIPVTRAECPPRNQDLENCQLNMEEGELCEANNIIPDFIENFEINNCGNRDIFRYSCEVTPSQVCDFKETFTATGCPNKEINFAIMEEWNDSLESEKNVLESEKNVLKNMLGYCNDVKNGIATRAQQNVCCGMDVNCQASLTCVEQTAMTWCSRKSQCTIKEDIDYLGSDILIIPQVEDAESCAKLCAQNSECAVWTYIKLSTHVGFKKCHLKSTNAITPTSNTCCESGLRDACPSASSTTSTINQEPAFHGNFNVKDECICIAFVSKYFGIYVILRVVLWMFIESISEVELGKFQL